MLLKDKVIIVSGVGPGMGLKMAINAAREGARGVVATARSQANLDAAEQAIKHTGTDCKVIALQNDIRDMEGCQRVADTTLR